MDNHQDNPPPNHYKTLGITCPNKAEGADAFIRASTRLQMEGSPDLGGMNKEDADRELAIAAGTLSLPPLRTAHDNRLLRTGNLPTNDASIPPFSEEDYLELGVTPEARRILRWRQKRINEVLEAAKRQISSVRNNFYQEYATLIQEMNKERLSIGKPRLTEGDNEVIFADPRFRSLQKGVKDIEETVITQRDQAIQGINDGLEDLNAPQEERTPSESS